MEKRNQNDKKDIPTSYSRSSAQVTGGGQFRQPTMRRLVQANGKLRTQFNRHVLPLENQSSMPTQWASNGSEGYGTRLPAFWKTASARNGQLGCLPRGLHGHFGTNDYCDWPAGALRKQDHRPSCGLTAFDGGEGNYDLSSLGAGPAPKHRGASSECTRFRVFDNARGLEIEKKK